VARASLEELLLDCPDYLRQRGLPLWRKDHSLARQVRRFCCTKNKSYSTYRPPYIGPPASPETAANTLVCLIHQANYLMDQQLRALEEGFLKEGGFTERLYVARQEARKRGKDR
jgi:four helix bundle suffix protein